MPNVELMIILGDEARMKRLFSFPNDEKHPDEHTLAETIEHWIGRTLVRDGIDATLQVEAGAVYRLRIVSPSELARGYERILPRFLDIGDGAFAVVEDLKRQGKWDEANWRFFLPLGLPLLNHASLQFFHYPPSRLLNYYRDYLDDPVPVRVEELLLANRDDWTDLRRYQSMTRDQRDRAFDIVRYEAVVDCAPIAAPDDHGEKIPFAAFGDYQKALVELLCHPHWSDPRYTIPVVVYGRHPREQFGKLFGLPDLKVMEPRDVTTIVAGRATRVLAINHPYAFYADIQRPDIGSGRINPDGCAKGAKDMVDDLAAAKWQLRMSQVPSDDPKALLVKARADWEARPHERCSLVRHQGSYKASGEGLLKYEFLVSLADGETWCAGHRDDPCAPPLG